MKCRLAILLPVGFCVLLCLAVLQINLNVYFGFNITKYPFVWKVEPPNNTTNAGSLQATVRTVQQVKYATKLPLTEKALTKPNITDPNDPSLQKELKRRLQKATERKVIVDYFGYFGGGKTKASQCGNCEVTTDKEKISDNATAAVLFYYNKISESRMPPKETRNPEHLYIFWCQESPPIVQRNRNFKFEDSYGFNATMTYRRNSDFYDGIYTSRLWQVFGERKMTLEDVSLKKKQAVCYISNCDRTPGARLRMKMVKRIRQVGYDLDTFGRCFPETGGYKKDFALQGEVIRQYKFYFSFENSYHCKDYITEKVYRNALYYRAVPVVLGALREDYEDFLPKGSFIYLEDFPTVVKLVEYLRYLDKNDTAFLEYFRWHNTPWKDMLLDGRTRGKCHVCRAVHGINIDDLHNEMYHNEFGLPRPIFDDKMTRRIIPSLSDWFFGEEKEECVESNETNLEIFSKYKLGDVD